MKMKSVSRQWPLLLFPVFFLLNAANEYYGDLDLHFFLRFGGYLLWLLLTVAIVNAIIFRNGERALAFSFLALLFLVFAKNIYKVLDPYMNRPVFFLLTAVFFTLAFVWIRNKKLPSGFSKGLLFVFCALILFESASILIKTVTKRNTRMELPDRPSLTSWQGDKPDIYLLLFDEYQGNEGLKDIFGYKNTDLTNFLNSRGFRVLTGPRSNYNYTYFSVPSMFAMSYLRYPDGKYALDYDRVIKSINVISNRNYFTDYLVSSGYQLRNFSLFDFHGSPTPYSFDGLDEDAYSVLFSRTLPGWLKTDLLHRIPSNTVHRVARDLYFQFFDYNRSVLKDTKDAVGRADGGPLFVYSHLLLPHLPVVTDSSGELRDIREAADDLHKNRPELGQTYLNYIKYANKVCRELVEDIIERDKGAVIIVMSDHGLRRSLGSSWVHNIQLAVRMPGRPDPGFYDGMTSVNLLRLVLNSVAGQKLGLLPDTVISVK